MMALESGFWRGYWPLFFAMGATQLSQQADIVMVSRLSGGASGAYAMVTRLVILDVVLMTAIGTVASTSVAHARRNGEMGCAIGQVLGLAALTGVCCGTLGLCLYPRAARWFAGDNDVVALIDSGIFWYSLAAPFRFLSGASAFILHALGDGALAVRWKLAEFVVKVVGNFILMDVIGLGFSGCFTSGAIIAIVSSIWCLRIFSANHAGWIRLPGQSGTLRFLRSTLWESQRLIAVQLSALLCLALFAAPWLGRYDVSRLNSYAAGQTFMVLLFAPFMAMMRFLAFRFLSLPEGRRVAAMRAIWAQGAPFVISAALLLLTNHEALGRLYGQQGPWWSSFVEVLAISLPLRYATNVLRALLHSRGAFAVVASADSAAFWLLAIPLVAIGLYADEPVVAYLSLILPEAASAALLWNRLPLSSPPELAGYGDEAISIPWKGDARDA